MKVPVKDVVVEKRQRLEFKNIDSLADSLRRIGQLNPIIISKKNGKITLVAGERRLRAAESLGWEMIEAKSIKDLSEDERDIIELEENIKRENLTWKEESLAVFDWHERQVDREEDWNIEATASAIGLSSTQTGNRIAVGRELQDSDSRIGFCDTMQAAINFCERKRSRALDEIVARIDESFTDSLDEDEEEDEEGEAVEAKYRKASRDVLVKDFREWVKTYKGRKFNLIHCDFPYGINYHESDQIVHETKHTYHDTEEVYFELLEAFLQNLDVFALESAHLMFWYSFKHEAATRAMFADMAPDLTIYRIPLIWHKTDNKGILPDAERGPRHTYETALLASRGDRRIVKAKAASYGAPTARASSLHISQKPEPVLRHFFEMFIEDFSEVFDPTCGSGTALVAAESLGAKRVLGLDIDEDHVKAARTLLEDRRQIEAMRHYGNA